MKFFLGDKNPVDEFKVEFFEFVLFEKVVVITIKFSASLQTNVYCRACCDPLLGESENGEK